MKKIFALILVFMLTALMVFAAEAQPGSSLSPPAIGVAGDLITVDAAAYLRPAEPPEAAVIPDPGGASSLAITNYYALGSAELAIFGLFLFLVFLIFSTGIRRRSTAEPKVGFL